MRDREETQQPGFVGNGLSAMEESRKIPSSHTVGSSDVVVAVGTRFAAFFESLPVPPVHELHAKTPAEKDFSNVCLITFTLTPRTCLHRGAASSCSSSLWPPSSSQAGAMSLDSTNGSDSSSQSEDMAAAFFNDSGCDEAGKCARWRRIWSAAMHAPCSRQHDQVPREGLNQSLKFDRFISRSVRRAEIKRLASPALHMATDFDGLDDLDYAEPELMTSRYYRSLVCSS